ncbi:IclR family transcriptional regulator [Bacillaceae bacterium S4-13-58]
MPIIQSVERALQILDLFDEYSTELKITEISEKMGLHKSTVHSLLKTLQNNDYISQNPENGKYHLGMKLVERGNYVISTIDIRQVAKRFLLELARKTGQTCHLGILDGPHGVYIDKVEGDRAVIRYSRIGRRIPLHSTAIGKVLLTFQKPDKIKELLTDYEYSQQTPHTIKSESTLTSELEQIKKQGYSIDNQENEQGVRCIAVPIRNHNQDMIGAISISTLLTQVNDEKLAEYIELLKSTGQEISQELGYRQTIS